MGRTVRGGSRNHTPNVRPVQKVELSEKNTRQRLIAVIVLLVIASGAFMYALNGLMSNDSGWTNIEASSSAEIHCGDDYIFRYYVGAAGVNATAEKKALTLLYTDSIVKAYKIFSSDESFEGITNVYDLNRHPNETMVVDDALYHAFELIAETGNRAIYLHRPSEQREENQEVRCCQSYSYTRQYVLSNTVLRSSFQRQMVQHQATHRHC